MPLAPDGLKKHRFCLLGMLLVLLLSTSAFGESFGVYEPEAQGFEESDARAVRLLLVSEIAKRPEATVVTLPADEKCSNIECAKSALEKYQTDAIVVGSLVKLGDKAIVIVDVVRKTGSSNYRMTADGLGELDRLMPRLVDSIISNKDFEKTATVSSVSEKEQETYKKRVAGDFSWGPGIGFIVPIADSYGGEVPTLLGVLVDFRYEIARWGFEVETGIYFDDQTSEFDSAVEWPLDFSGMYFFSESANSFLLGGTLGLHYLAVNHTLSDEEVTDNDTDVFTGRVKAAASGNSGYKVEAEKEGNWSQFAPSIALFAGYEFLRTHTFHVATRAGYRYNIAELDGHGAHGPFVSIGFTFGHNN